MRCWASDSGTAAAGRRAGNAARGGRRDRAVLDAGGQRGHGRGLEQRAHGDAGVERGAEPGDHLGGDQRVAAEVEEVVVEPTAVAAAEHLGEDRGDDLLDRGARRTELGRPRTSGSGSAFRSSLPLALSGNSSSTTIAAGTM